jgi:hypothetical protein
MFQRSCAGLLKWMKPISEVNGRTNEKQSGMWVLNRGRETKKQPVLGILCCNRTVWANVADHVESGILQLLILKNESIGSIVCSDTGKASIGIAARGNVHRRVNHGERQYSDSKGNPINGLEEVWGISANKNSFSTGGI